jgi:hypothetical protein
MTESREDSSDTSEWVVSFYKPIIAGLIIWVAVLISLSASGFTVANLFLSGTIVAGAVGSLVLMYVSYRSDRLSALFWWAWAISILLTGAPASFFAIMSLDSIIWIIIIGVIGIVVGLFLLIYYWQCIEKGIEPWK